MSPPPIDYNSPSSTIGDQETVIIVCHAQLIFWLAAGSIIMPSCPAPLVQLRPVATHTPAAADEGTVRECPICFEEITQNQEWLLLPCKHGVCVTCYQKLIQDQHQVTTCPLCRMPLLEPVPKQTNASSLATAPGTPTMSCPRSVQHMPVITQAPSNWFQIHMSLPMVQPSASLPNQRDLQPAGCPPSSIV